MLAALVGLGGALGSVADSTGWLSHSSQKSMNKATSKRALAQSLVLMQYQDKLERAYSEHIARNSPSWTVGGLRAAGLNPILAASGGFSQSTASLGAGGSVPSSTGSGPSGHTDLDFVNSILQNEVLAKQAQDLEADRELKNAQADKVRSESKFTDTKEKVLSDPITRVIEAGKRGTASISQLAGDALEGYVNTFLPHTARSVLRPEDRDKVIELDDGRHKKVVLGGEIQQRIKTKDDAVRDINQKLNTFRRFLKNRKK